MGGKTHKGVCHKLNNIIQQLFKQGGDAPRKWAGKSATKNYIKQMVISETKKSQKQKGKQRRSYSSSDSNFSTDEESWRSGISGVEQIHMLSYTRINPNDSDIEFDSADKKRYQKQAKKWSKGKYGKR